MLSCQRHHCDNGATVRMFAPDGVPVPGGFYCTPHATATVDEYRKKLGEYWTLLPIDRHGNTHGHTLRSKVLQCIQGVVELRAHREGQQMRYPDDGLMSLVGDLASLDEKSVARARSTLFALMDAATLEWESMQ